MKRQGGFTLIELSAVILLLSILATIALPRFINFSEDASLAQLRTMKGALIDATELVHAKAILQGVSDAQTATVDVGGQNIQVSFGYPTGHWNQAVKYLVNLDVQAFTEVDVTCEEDWCGRGNQRSLPSGVSTSTGRVAKIYSRGYLWADRCDVYYLNHQDGTPPIIEIESDDCR